MELLHVAALPSASSDTSAPRPVTSRISAGDVALVPRVDGHGGPQPLGERQHFVIDIDGDHPRLQGTGDHDRGQPHPAAAVDGDPLARPDPALRDHRPKGRGEPAPETRRRDEVDLRRQANQIHIGVSNGDILCIRAPPGKARLELPVADLLIAAATLRARPARAHERQRDAVPRLPPGDVLSRLRDDPRQLVAGHVRQAGDIRVVPEPAVPIAPADAAGLDLDHHAVVVRHRIGHLTHRHRPAELLKNHRLHNAPPSC